MLKRLARLLLGDYGYYRIYACISTAVRPPDRERSVRCAALSTAAPLLHTPWESLHGLVAYGGGGAHLYGVWLGAELAGAACYWNPQRYAARGFITLMPDEAKLVQILIAEPYRGRGLATRLLRHSAADLSRLGFRRLLARVWHNHRASAAAFERAGWIWIAQALEVRPLGVRRALRFQWRVDAAAPASVDVRAGSLLPLPPEPRR